MAGFQWQKLNVGPYQAGGAYEDVAGETGPTLATAVLTAGKFRCHVVNAAGSVDSEPQVGLPGWAQRLLDNAGGGLAATFRVPGGAVEVVDPGSPGNNYSGDKSWWNQAGTSPKLCRQVDGTLRWSDHNLALYSEDLTNWTNVNTTDSGTTLTASAGTAVHSITRAQAALAAGPNYTARVRLKAGTHAYAYLNVRGDASEDFVTVIVDLSTVAVTQTDVGTSSGTIVSSAIAVPPSYDADFGLGWYDVTVTFTLASVSAPVFCVGLAGAASGNTMDSTGTTSWNAAGTETIQLKRAQLNRGRTALDYLLTTAAAVFSLAQHYDAALGWGLLIEGTYTNLCLYSNDATNAAWTKVNMSTALTSTGPDGYANTATRLTAAGGTGTIKQSITSASAVRLSSVWLKRVTGTGTIDVTQDDGATWIPVAVTTTWTRFDLPVVTAANPIVGIRINTVGDAVDMWCFQHVVGGNSPFQSSPIPTLGATVTRAADVITKSVAALPWSATAGFVVMRFKDPEGTNQFYLIDISDGTGNEKFHVLRNGTTLLYQVIDGGVTQASFTPVTGLTSPGLITLAFSWAADSFKGSANSAAVTTDTAGTLPAVTTIHLGYRGNAVALGIVGMIFDLLWLPRVPTADAEMLTAQTEIAA